MRIVTVQASRVSSTDVVACISPHYYVPSQTCMMNLSSFCIPDIDGQFCGPNNVLIKSKVWNFEVKFPSQPHLNPSPQAQGPGSASSMQMGSTTSVKIKDTSSRPYYCARCMGDSSRLYLFPLICVFIDDVRPLAFLYRRSKGLQGVAHVLYMYSSCCIFVIEVDLFLCHREQTHSLRDDIKITKHYGSVQRICYALKIY